MKKLICLLAVVCILCSYSLALAADTPFESGVNYSDKYDEFGAVPSMLNFGSASIAPGQVLADAKTKTITSIRVKTLENQLDDGDTFYCYAKWQYAQSIVSYRVDAMLVMTTPDKKYYAVYDSLNLEDAPRKAIFSCFFDVTDCLNRCREENNGFKKGTYFFSLFFNDLSFRVAEVKIK